jgi:hypothetical protein
MSAVSWTAGALAGVAAVQSAPTEKAETESPAGAPAVQE